VYELDINLGSLRREGSSVSEDVQEKVGHLENDDEHTCSMRE
jgi:hypothetical protein